MRAVNGAVVSAKPCSLGKSIRVLARFADSHLPSSDAATYLRTTAEAANDLYIFRRDLRKYQRGDVEAAHESVKRGRDQDREWEAVEKGLVVLSADGPQGTCGEKKSKKKKKNVDVPCGGLHSH